MRVLVYSLLSPMPADFFKLFSRASALDLTSDGTPVIWGKRDAALRSAALLIGDPGLDRIGNLQRSFVFSSPFGL